MIDPSDFLESRLSQAVENRVRAADRLTEARRDVEAAQQKVRLAEEHFEKVNRVVAGIKAIRQDFVELVALRDGPFRLSLGRLSAARKRESAAHITWMEEYTDQPLRARLYAAQELLHKASEAARLAEQDLDRSFAEESQVNARVHAQEHYFAIAKELYTRASDAATDARHKLEIADSELSSTESQWRTVEKAVTDLENRLYRERRIDELTGLLNVAQFKTDSQTVGKGVLISIDLDRFKAVNDERGHAAGDDLLRQFGAFLAEIATSAGGLAYRNGGDEFSIICPPRERRGLIRLVTRMKSQWASRQTPVTMSIGVARFSAFAAPDEVCKAADAASYESKKAGRDQAHLASRGHFQPLC